MTRAEFLNDLYHHLRGMTREQAEQHLTYYAEMLDDRMEEGMSEAEAVESMEDVETIARRILEEEGLPASPPVVPPEYPDVSRPDGGGGGRWTKARQMLKRLHWRKALHIALWALAIVVILSAFIRWLWMRNIRSADYPTDYVAEGVREASDMDEYTYMEEYAEFAEYAHMDEYAEYADMEAPCAEGYGYSGVEYSFDCEEISSVDIQWASGTVFVQSWSGDSIQLQEHARSALNDRTRMSCQSNGGKLTVRFRNRPGLGRVKGSKWLTVLVPDGMLEELEIQTASAEVVVYGLELACLDMSTISGSIAVSECYTQQANLATTSGDTDLATLYAETLELGTTSGCITGTVVSGELSATSISGDMSLCSAGDMEAAHLSSVSGDIRFSVEAPSAGSLGVNTVSGNVSLSLPDNLGFTLDFFTTSGGLQPSGSFELSQQGGKYICNGGGCKIQVNTVSGDLDIS